MARMSNPTVAGAAVADKACTEQGKAQEPVIDLCSDSDHDEAESKRQRGNDGAKQQAPVMRAEPSSRPLTRSRSSLCDSSAIPEAPSRTKKRRRSSTFNRGPLSNEAGARNGRDAVPPRPPRQGRRFYRTRSVTAAGPSEDDEPEIVEPAVDRHPVFPEAGRSQPFREQVPSQAGPADNLERPSPGDKQCQGAPQPHTEGFAEEPAGAKQPGVDQHASTAEEAMPQASVGGEGMEAGAQEETAKRSQEPQGRGGFEMPEVVSDEEMRPVTPESPRSVQLRKAEEAIRHMRAELACAQESNNVLRERVSRLQKSLTAERVLTMKAQQDVEKWRERAQQLEAEALEHDRARKRHEARHRWEDEITERRTTAAAPGGSAVDMRASAHIAIEAQRQAEMERQRLEAQELKAQKAKERAKREQLEKQQHDALQAHRDNQRKEAEEKEKMHNLKSNFHQDVSRAAKMYMPRNLVGFMTWLGYADFSQEARDLPLQKQLKLAKRLTHPDKQHSKTSKERALAEETFKKLSEWEVLC